MAGRVLRACALVASVVMASADSMVTVLSHKDSTPAIVHANIAHLFQPAPAGAVGVEAFDGELAAPSFIEKSSSVVKRSVRRSTVSKSKQQMTANDQSKWLLHSGLLIPYHNSYQDGFFESYTGNLDHYGECVVGTKLPPAYCAVNHFGDAARFTCGSSSDCLCQNCEESSANGIPNMLTQVDTQDRVMGYIWRPYCHKLGINCCRCGLVALWKKDGAGLDAQQGWYNLTPDQCHAFGDIKYKGIGVPKTDKAYPYSWGENTDNIKPVTGLLTGQLVEGKSAVEEGRVNSNFYAAVISKDPKVGLKVLPSRGP